MDKNLALTSFSIKNLINLYEKQSQSERYDVHQKAIKINKINSKNVTAMFDSLKKIQTAQPSLNSSVSELEERVSVKSLVYNFQRLSSTTDSVTTKSYVKPQWSVKPSIQSKMPVFEKKSPQPIKSKPLSSTIITSQPTKIIKTGLFDMKLVEKPNIHQEVIIEKKDSFEEEEEEEAGESKTYEFNNNTLLAVDEAIMDSNDVPSVDVVSPLPESYKVVSQCNGHLLLKLPPPPKKSVIKKNGSKINKAVKFNDQCQVAETYNKEEYERVNEIDVIGSGLEYGFENMLEHMTRKSFTLHRENNEPLGLNIYGVQVYTKSKDSMAVYVKCVNPGSLCDRCGTFLENDLIIEVNGIDMIGVELSKVSQAIKAGGSDVSFVIGRDTTTSIEDASA